MKTYGKYQVLQNTAFSTGNFFKGLAGWVGDPLMAFVAS